MKSNRNLSLEQYYTDDKLVSRLLEIIRPEKYKTVIEPSAGAGAFSNRVPGCLAFDIEPKHDSIKKADFLKLQIDTDPSKTLIFGNPPFGRQASLAIKFMKKSCKLADTVAFILPRSFKKDSMKDKVPLTHSCILELDLGEVIFHEPDDNDILVKCVFQIWKKLSTKREKNKKLSTDMFDWCDKEEASLFLTRVGGNAGNIGFEIENKSKKSNYFIKPNKMNTEDIYKAFKSIDWQHNNTTGPRSISKQEFLKQFLKLIRE